MNVKHTNYLAKSMKAALNTSAHPKPYTYREQLSRGFTASKNPYEFNFRIAAYCDVFNISYSELARRGQALSDANGWGIRLTKADIHNYVYCHCKPKSEKRFLIGRLIGVEDAWLAGYNKTINKEYLVESLIDNAGDGPTPALGVEVSTVTKPNAPREISISKNAFSNIARMIKEAKELENKLGKNA